MLKVFKTFLENGEYAPLLTDEREPCEPHL